MILAIDPGNIQSAYCLIDKETYKPIKFAKVDNEELFCVIDSIKEQYTLVIEMVACYGMPVGKEVFDTCVWIGRFIEYYKTYIYYKYDYIYRREEKINLCNSMKAKDSNIRQALIDRFGEVGTKANKGFFYGFKSDIWSAYAVGVTYLDKSKDI